MVATLLPIAFLAANSATSRLVRSLFDDTFSGVHQLSWFDWAILIPYFAILTLLSVYGIHRYEIDPHLLQASQEGYRRAAQAVRAIAARLPSNYLSSTSGM